MTQTEQMATDLSVLDSATSDSRAFVLGFLAALRYDTVRDNTDTDPPTDPDDEPFFQEVPADQRA